MLCSIAMLRSMEAIVDFKTGHALLRAIDPDTVIQLDRAEAGHLLLDITKNLTDQTASKLLAETNIGCFKKVRDTLAGAGR